jgi:hypothetical protein
MHAIPNNGGAVILDDSLCITIVDHHGDRIMTVTNVDDLISALNLARDLQREIEANAR